MTRNSIIHAYEVGFTMRKLAKLTGICSEEESFCIGYLHDIGKEFIENQPISMHNKVGEEVLKTLGVSFAEIVGAHGDPDSKLIDTPIVKMLNYCDLVVDHDGSAVTIEQRLDGVIKRYGYNSKQYNDVIQIIQNLEQGEWTRYKFDKLLFENI